MKSSRKIMTATLAFSLIGTSLAGLGPVPLSQASAASNNAVSKASTQRDRTAIQQAVRDILAQLGIPGVIANISEGDNHWSYAAGVADTRTKKPMKADFRFRIGSVTKTFTATVVLQLAGEKKLNLEDSIEKWLPGIVQGNGYDGTKITIRQLLNHTSGIADYFSSTKIDMTHPKKSYTAEELVKIGLSFPKTFAPGESWAYSNTGYILLSMLIEKLTGNSYEEEIEQRIIEPLELSDTFLPGNSSIIPGNNHARGYYQPDMAMKPIDVTYINPSAGGAAGGMISSGDDLNKFYSALLGGKLLKEDQLKQMLTTVSTSRKDQGYGLGITETKLSNGVSVWGHTGGIPGFGTLIAAEQGGKHTLILNLNYFGGAINLNTFDNILLREFAK